MKFTLNIDQYSEMSKYLTLLTRVTGLKNVLIKIKFDNECLTLSAYGQLGKIEIYIPTDRVTGSVHGSVVVKDDFIKLIKTIPVTDSNSVNFSLGSNNNMSIKLDTSRSKYSVKCLAPEMVANINFGSYLSKVSVNVDDIINGLNVKLFCKSESESVDVFSSVNMKVCNSGLKFIASDTSTIVCIDYKRKLDSEFSLLIPNQISSIIQGILGAVDGVVDFGVTDTGHGLVTYKSFKYLFSTFVGNYPDVSGILSFKTKNPITLNNQEFLNKLQILNNLTSFKVVKLTVDDGLIINNTDTETLEIEEFINANCESRLSVHMMLKYLIVFLTQFKKENLNLVMHIDKRILLNAEISNASYSMITTPVIER